MAPPIANMSASNVCLDSAFLVAQVLSVTKSLSSPEAAIASPAYNVCKHTWFTFKSSIYIACLKLL